MSHLTTIKTSIKSHVILERVLHKLLQSQLDILTGATLETNSIIKDYYGNSTIADFVIRRPRHNYNLGFKLNSQGEYEFISDNDAWGKTKFMEALLPMYARENTIYQLLAQGFEIESQTENDGTIKIVAGKWS
ncbi:MULTISPECIES: DUF1257 domain-containing protein [Planktothrix]|jgi:hypothetical protein|uniref:DUF1257 domain-containing protein n=3 Tax=Planktothrix TaxID=54304 RepID=A0A073CAM1_PLAA1|nr:MULTISPECIES: DUF1257 domain-containing protein [Planktothrix]BBD57194.1 hypothetical protein NIES204_45300 [Planktothrix agardhii NIES-204]KEI65166.1 hypothetical protein A19Y_7003 [Planktothrix agardhii NIVA-CYA 126/8]MCB8762102.1 DUF1257 domain-containing protein [Planktothrix agardhii 1813]MCB8766511.1 DUF1257 domain-containing protein [Planktothrix agardhii 1809]MCB8780265.1 DUF1257 domain-containing protein [Planktothrix agardhii 1031]